ncbi:MAG: response regulator [Labilithrix sp.]|nr:response regulator [Labilithrix sp.]MCW5816145.1 response regulator [Labilithrix sp.]
MTVEAGDIVLVEDSDEDAELTMRALKRQKLAHTVRRLSDGQQAVDYFFAEGDGGWKTPPRVVLLDLKLPMVNGLEILRRLKMTERTHDIPVVVLTSSKEDRDLEEAYRLGANSYIVKPVEFDKFMHAVESLGMYWMLINQAR